MINSYLGLAVACPSYFSGGYGSRISQLETAPRALPRELAEKDRHKEGGVDSPTTGGSLEGAQMEVVSFVDGSFFARIFLTDDDRCRGRSFVRPVCAAHVTAGPDEPKVRAANSAYRVPIRQTS